MNHFNRLVLLLLLGETIRKDRLSMRRALVACPIENLRNVLATAVARRATVIARFSAAWEATPPIAAETCACADMAQAHPGVPFACEACE